MPITVDGFKKNPYLVGTFQVPASVAGNVPVAGLGAPPTGPRRGNEVSEHTHDVSDQHRTERSEYRAAVRN